jgi:hypothetical protein
MKEQLELKHIAPYLPYGITIYFENEKGDTWKKTLAMHCSESRNEFAYHLIDEENNWKPLLRPLSDLTKEIEHNGEKFVPNEKLNWDEGNVNHFIQRDSQDYVDYIIRPFEHRQLCEWHFDVFGLIDKGLAIKKDR